MKKTNPLLCWVIVMLAALGLFMLHGFMTPAWAQTTGLVGHWKFDEGSGTIASDSSGSGNNFALVSGTTWTVGKIGAGALFNGINNYAWVSTIRSGPWSGDYTISFWVKAGAVGQPQYASVFSNFGGGASKDSLQIDVDGTNPGNYRLSTTNVYLIAPVTADWQFITVSLTGTTLRTYNNGALTNTYILTAGESNVFRQYIIGVNRAGNRFFKGSIDELRLHNRGLSAAEVQAMYSGATQDSNPPIITSVSASSITTTTATITWTTNEVADSQLEYGLTSSYGNATPLNASLVLNHSQSLAGLLPNTTYHYRVRSRDGSGNIAVSQDFTFATLSQDLAPPIISNVGVLSLSTTTALITWATNELSDSQIQYGLTSSYGNATALNTSPVLNHSQSLAGLVPNTTYHYRVTSRDAAGNVAISQNYTFTTNPVPSLTGKPNIILILADDLGWRGIGAYGQDLIQTPNLDDLASEGMLFAQAYSGSSSCCPARSALLTGQHTGHTRLRLTEAVDPISGAKVYDPGPLLLRDVTIAEVLKTAGYNTALVGKWHTGSAETSGQPNFQGFDYFFGHLTQSDGSVKYFPSTLRENDKNVAVPANTYVEDLYTQKAVDFITQYKDQPFFLHLTYNTPHVPLIVPSYGPYTGRPWNDNQKAFAAMITRMDSNIGTLMTALSNLGLDHNTLVIFTSDNGPEFCCWENWDVEFLFKTAGPLRGYKSSLYEGGIRVPFIARWPGRIPAGAINNEPIASWDLLPTFADLAGVAPSRGIDGIPILPALLGQGSVSREYLYWELPLLGGLQAVRMGDLKGVFVPPSTFELYNLAMDPSEKNNIAASNLSIVQKMQGIMKTGRTVGAQDGFPMPFVDPAIVCRQREFLNGVDLLSYSGASTSCASFALANVGERAYTDDPFTISTLPAAYNNQVLLRNANQDRSFQWSTYSRIAVRQPSTVAVAYDASASVLPSWLQSWTRTGEVVSLAGSAQGNLSFNLYSKSFPQNATILLGGNTQDGGNASRNYLVFVNTHNPPQAPTGLIGRWSFDEPSGNIALDSSGYEYDGILYNGTIVGNGPVRVAGSVGGGLSFDGVNDFVSINTGDTRKGDYTVTLWVRAGRTAQPIYASVFANLKNFDGGGGTFDSFQIDVDGGSPGVYRLSTHNRSYPIAPVSTQPQFLTVTLSGTALKTYNNGSLTASYTLAAGESNFSRDYLIGTNRGGNRFFHGAIDDVRVYNRALSAAEIAAIFNGTQ